MTSQYEIHGEKNLEKGRHVETKLPMLHYEIKKLFQNTTHSSKSPKVWTLIKLGIMR